MFYFFFSFHSLLSAKSCFELTIKYRLRCISLLFSVKNSVTILSNEILIKIYIFHSWLKSLQQGRAIRKKKNLKRTKRKESQKNSGTDEK